MSLVQEHHFKQAAVCQALGLARSTSYAESEAQQTTDFDAVLREEAGKHPPSWLTNAECLSQATRSSAIRQNPRPYSDAAFGYHSYPQALHCAHHQQPSWF